MQRGMAVVIAAAAALTTGAVRGVAGAQQSTPAAPAAPEQRLLSVTGAAESTVPVAAGVGARQAAYRDALGAALDDANAKAAFVAQRVGLVIGAVQSVTEQSSAAELLRGGLRGERDSRAAQAPCRAQACLENGAQGGTG
jgi:uncharacterized protein YggE